MQKTYGLAAGGPPGGGGPHAMAQVAQWLIRPCSDSLCLLQTSSAAAGLTYEPKDVGQGRYIDDGLGQQFMRLICRPLNSGVARGVRGASAPGSQGWGRQTE